MDKEILDFIKRVQSMAKIGLSYAADPYDIERYEELRDSTHSLLARGSASQQVDLARYFDSLDAYPTPKVDVRGLVLMDRKVLMIKEKVDEKWALPGGWCDIGYSPKENIEKEVWEESGFWVKANRLLSVWDKRFHDHPPEMTYVYKLNFLCEITGGKLNPGHETLGADFFEPDDLPSLSLPRNTAAQIKKLFALASTDVPTEFD